MLTMVMSLVLLQQPALRQAPEPASWADVAALRRGTAVRVTTDTRDRTSGRVVDVDAQTIAVDDGFEVRRFGLARVLRVERRRDTHEVRNGFLSGAAFGLAMSVVTVKSNRGAAYPVLTFGWGAIGAAGGLFAHAINPTYDVIFQRRP